MTKGVEAIAAVYGVMKAGAAYVPMDPKAPDARASRTMANDCAAAMVTTPERSRRGVLRR